VCSSDLREFGGPEDTVIAGLLFTGVLAAALYACLSGVMVMPASQITGLLVCGMLLGLYPFSPDRPHTILPWAFVPGLLLTLGLLGLGAHELRTMEARESQMLPAETGLPRIWQNAKVCRQYGRENEVKN
jgi:peptidoglycan/LPS O-acetylase OafA/YrhL